MKVHEGVEAVKHVKSQTLQSLHKYSLIKNLFVTSSWEEKGGKKHWIVFILLSDVLDTSC